MKPGYFNRDNVTMTKEQYMLLKYCVESIYVQCEDDGNIQQITSEEVGIQPQDLRERFRELDDMFAMFLEAKTDGLWIGDKLNGGKGS